MKFKYIILFFLSFLGLNGYSQVWQWSIKVNTTISPETNDHPQAFLWIPENCKQVKGIVFGQHNMVEEGMLEHVYFRKTLAEIGFAEVWVTPVVSWTYEKTKNEDKIIESMFQSLADVSGYKELAFAPVIPIGHSAMASFPWNYAAFNLQRTLSLVSIHGDAPQSNLTGSGKPNPDWGNRNIDGIPALFIMGEYEWWEDRIKPAYKYIAKHPESVITLFTDAGHGHFDYSDEMVKYVADYIKKVAQQRLPSKMPLDNLAKLKKINPQSGWLMDKWRKDSVPQFQAASFEKFQGDRKTASWVFDKEMAKATESFYARSRGKKKQFIGFKQSGEILKPSKDHANYKLDFKPLEDGISFHLNAFFTDSTKIKPANDFTKTTLEIDRICGPVKKVNDSTFQLNFYRMGFNNPKRSNDIWLLAHSKSDEGFKSAVQQLNMRFPLINKEGTPQWIDFDAIKDVKSGIKKIKLQAHSTAGSTVNYYVKEGPAFIKNNELHFTKIPPRAKFPVKVTVVAWQYGIVVKSQSATPVERSFYIER
ncbi:hypothetical protein [Flavobacterium seoulense]|uniref:Alpha/beta hydrolase n=1 Tax=Flavobacterium seoulense TaxID=1492738 RepID=A0A066WQX3_9FLAO|nr:hypothetical protein [Flavobacterium seoulense]KDN56226.1 hypothetical protein FEM21_07780 [Flavobacterium seoulense]